MALIEGIGDEVIVTLGVGLAVLLILIAWWSTHVPDIGWPRVIQWQVIIAREVGPQNAVVQQFTVTSREDEQDVVTPVVVESSRATSSVQPASGVPPAFTQDAESSNVALVDGDARGTAATLTTGATAVAEPFQTADASGQSRPDSDSADAATSSTDTSGASEALPVIDTARTSAALPTTDTAGAPEASLSAEQYELRRRRCNFFGGQLLSQVEADNRSVGAVHTPHLASVDGEQPSQCSDNRSSVPPSDIRDGGDFASNDGSKIRIRLRYLTETERLVLACPSTTVMSFKRQNFAEDLAANKLVRFIFNGQVLQDDRTLESYNIIDNTVVHTLISLADGGSQQGGAAGRQSAMAADSHEAFDTGSLMVPLFALILAVIWYLRFAYRQFFSITSTLSLVGITLLFGICLFANHRRQRQQHQHVAAAST